MVIIILEKSDCLFLIIGTNPLPNIIAAFSRVKPGGIIYLCYTQSDDGFSQTKAIAEEIHKLLREKYGKTNENDKTLQIVELLLEKSDILRVQTEIKKNLQSAISKLKEGQTVELNYTGGTKAMSSGAYYGFKAFMKNEEVSSKFNFILSYVDGEKEELYYERIKNGAVIYDKVSLDKLHYSNEIRITDIARLHDKRLFEEAFRKEPLYGKGAEVLFNMFLNIDEEKYKRNIAWHNRIHEEFSKKKNQIDLEVLDYFEGEKNITLEIKNTFQRIRDYEGSKTFAVYKGWITGKWMENYCFEILLQMKEEDVFEDMIHSAVDHTREGFEIDFLVFRKFRLFGISISEAEEEDLDLVKHKYYEIRERARQIGGAEAGICLFCLLKDSSVIEKEIKSSWEEELNKNILIIGSDKFLNFKDELKNWIRRKS